MGKNKEWGRGGCEGRERVEGEMSKQGVIEGGG